VASHVQGKWLWSLLKAWGKWSEAFSGEEACQRYKEGVEGREMMKLARPHL